MTARNTMAPTRAAQRQHVIGRLIDSRSRGAKLLRLILVALAVLLSLSLLRSTALSLLRGGPHSSDILQEYTLVRAIAEGVNPYLPTQELAERYLGAMPEPTFSHPTPHPPTLGLLVLPLALLDYPTAVAVWFGLEVLCLAISAYLLGCAAGARLSLRAALGISAVLFIWYPFPVEMSVGQVQLPILALLAGSWVALRAGRSALAGVLVGLSILLKPVPWPLLLWFALRENWRALRAALSLLAVGYLLAGCVIGWDSLKTYFTRILPLVASIYRSCWGNFSLSSLAWRLLQGTEENGTVLAPPVVAWEVGARIASVGLPALLLLVACMRVRKDRDLGASLGLMVIVSILVSPTAWAFYLVLVAIPAAHVIRWLERHRWPSRETNLAIVVALLLSVNWVGLAGSLAVQWVAAHQAVTLPFALAQLPLITAVAVGALAWLVARLGSVESGVPARMEN